MNAKTKTLLFVWCVAVFLGSLAHCQEITGPDDGPVKIGQPMLFKVAGAESTDTIKWQLLKPQTNDVTVIQTPDGTHYILDTGCSYRGDVQVLCTLVNFENQKFEQVVLQAVVDGEVPEPLESTSPNPLQLKNPDYVGPNEMGVGKVSFENAPEYNSQVVKLIRDTAESLYGRPQLRVIYTTDKVKNKTDYNAIVYLKSNLERKHPEFSNWWIAVMEQIEENRTDVFKLEQWYETFIEAAEGIEAKKES